MLVERCDWELPGNIPNVMTPDLVICYPVDITRIPVAMVLAETHLLSLDVKEIAD